MSKSICKNILFIADALLLALSLTEVTEWWQAACSVLILAVICFYLSYMNRALFLFSSDRMTLPLLYLLTVLPCKGIMTVEWSHLAPLLVLAVLYCMLKFISEEKVRESLVFVSLLFFSCAAVMLPPLVWLLVPLVISVFSKVRSRRFPVFLMIVAALIIPSIYIFAYDYIFAELDILRTLTEWSSRALEFKWNWEFSAVNLFFVLVTGVAVLITFSGALGRISSERDTCRRYEFRFLSTFLLFSLMVLYLFSYPSAPLLMVAAMPWSFIFLSFAEGDFYGVRSRNVILLVAVSSLVLRFAEYI